jgi:hypothetical protein
MWNLLVMRIPSLGEKDRVDVLKVEGMELVEVNDQQEWMAFLRNMLADDVLQLRPQTRPPVRDSLLFN